MRHIQTLPEILTSGNSFLSEPKNICGLRNPEIPHMLTLSIKQLLILLIFLSETDIETTAYEHTETKVEK